MKTIIFAIAGVFLCLNVFGQNNYMDGDKKYRIYTKFGIEPTSVVALGIEYRSNLELLDAPVGFYGETTHLFFTPGFANAEYKLGSVYYKSLIGSFGFSERLNVSTGTIKTINFDAKKYAVASALDFGFYKQKWYWSFLTIEFEKIMATRLEHTAHYRTVFYSDAVDGWYKTPGGSWQFGMEWGKTWNSIDFNIELKVPFTENFKAYAGAPYHLTMGLGYRF